MEKSRLEFADAVRPGRSGAFLLDDDGRVTLRLAPALAAAVHASRGEPTAHLAPFHFDDRRRGILLAASLLRGVASTLLEMEFVAGSFEIRAYIDGGWVRLTLRPADFDPDAAWEFLLTANDAKLAAPQA